MQVGPISPAHLFTATRAPTGARPASAQLADLRANPAPLLDLRPIPPRCNQHALPSRTPAIRAAGAGHAAMSRVSAALNSQDKGRATPSGLAQMLLAAAGPAALVAAIDLESPFLVDTPLAGLCRVGHFGCGKMHTLFQDRALHSDTIEERLTCVCARWRHRTGSF